MPVVAGNLTTSERMYEVLDLTSERSSQSALMLQGLINSASAYIASQCGRTFKYGSVTEYHSGDGDCVLVADQFPIIAVTSLHVDGLREWGSASEWDEEEEFVVEHDTGTILGKSTYFSEGPRNIRLIYTYGPDAYIVGPTNNTLKIIEDSSPKTATVVSGAYNAVTFATALQTALTAIAGSGITYTVAYDVTAEVFTVTASGDSTTTLSIDCDNDNPTIGLCKLLGFNTDADKTGALSYTSDEPSPGVDAGVEEACRMLVSYWIQVAREKPWNHRAIERAASGTTIRLDPTDIPPFIAGLIMPYKRPWRSRSW